MSFATSLTLAYAVTPCHAGNGSSLGVVDLPIERERHTNWPVVFSSGVKGALRAHVASYGKMDEETRGAIDRIFGDSKAANVGTVSFSDLKLLAFPVRSDVAPFIWITCPAVLKRLQRDIEFCNFQNNNLSLTQEDREFISSLSVLQETDKFVSSIAQKDKILIEDVALTREKSLSLSPNLVLINTYLGSVKDRLAIVSDSIFDYAVSNCTEVVPQIRIDQEKGTTAKGSLRYQEELPSDTLMYWITTYLDTVDAKDKKTLENAIGQFVQIGGDLTCGRGIFQVSILDRPTSEGKGQ